MSTKGEDVMNIALATEDDIRELYLRKAEMQDDKIIVRSYVPPNFYERFFHLGRICTEKKGGKP